MKARGIFAVMTAMLVGLAQRAKLAFAPTPGSGTSNRSSGGRDAFLSISAPRCHTQKPRRR